MKVYQCIRAYDPYIPEFEKKYRIKENDYSFSQIRKLLIDDGFANTYILKPAFEGVEDELFFTFWNYKTLQYQWATENGLKTRSLDEIRLAQIKEYQPDVYYNFSPRYDTPELEEIFKINKLITVCWDATIGFGYPPFREKYKLRATLFEPYLKFWNQHGFRSFLLPPAFPDTWNSLNHNKKDIDILFYGQYNYYFFSDRNKIVEKLIWWCKKNGYTLKIHLQIPNHKKPLINIRGFRKFTQWMPYVSGFIRDNSLPPIYGQRLYETISRSKIVVNAFGNFNGLYKDNMRNYESIGCGAFLISEDGIYPDHFMPDVDFYTYRTIPELFEKIEAILSLPDQGFSLVQSARKKLANIYSKEKQWNEFTNTVLTLS